MCNILLYYTRQIEMDASLILTINLSIFDLVNKNLIEERDKPKTYRNADRRVASPPHIT